MVFRRVGLSWEYCLDTRRCAFWLCNLDKDERVIIFGSTRVRPVLTAYMSVPLSQLLAQLFFLLVYAGSGHVESRDGPTRGQTQQRDRKHQREIAWTPRGTTQWHPIHLGYTNFRAWHGDRLGRVTSRGGVGGKCPHTRIAALDLFMYSYFSTFIKCWLIYLQHIVRLSMLI